MPSPSTTQRTGEQSGAGRQSSAAGSPAKQIARAEALPLEALDLLNESTADSCSICAGKKRKEAFQLLAEVYPPGTILRSSAARRFVRAGEQEIVLSDYSRPEPGFSFHFHDRANHLIGIAESDLTDSTLVASLPAVTSEFDGAIEIVAFEYGDGPTFHYSTSSNHLEVQCRVLEVTKR